MFTNHKLAKAIKIACAFGAVSTLGFSGATFAQEQSSADRIEKISVTGSRIKRADIEGANPVTIMTALEIEAFGVSSIGDILQSLPAAGSAINTNSNNGGNGSTTVDIRGLGSNRTLVLVNGKRWAGGLGGVVDLNNIPSAIIERVEVLKDGASAVYGSDAVAGVVNIITKTDFEGLTINGYMGEYLSEGDGNREAFDIGIGTVSDKGNVYVNVSYVEEEATFAGDREVSAVPVFGAPTGFGGSSGTPNGRFWYFDENGDSFNSQNDGNGNLIPWTGESAFNFAPFNYLSTPQERFNIYAQANYEITDNVRFVSTANYGNRRSAQALAPTPLFLGTAGGTSTVIAADQPFNPTGIELRGGQAFGEPNTLYFSGRRMFEAGFRVFEQNVDQYQFNGGFEGSFEVANKEFYWDASYTYADIRQNQLTEGLLNTDRVDQSLLGPADCNADNGCVPLNLFGGSSDIGVGTITQEMIDYISFTAQDTQGTTLKSYQANLSGEIAELPAGPLGFAIGWEKRWNDGFDQPDALIAAGITSGNSRQPTSGDFSVEEAYIELAVPILADVAFAQNLSLELATRFSDYSNFGNTTNSKVGVTWRVNEELMVRGTWSEAFRAPSIVELFRGAADNFGNVTDPCNGGAAGNPTLPGCAGIPAAYSQPNTQIRSTVGGNVNLDPEEAESFTYGVVYSPEWLEGLSLTLDVFDIEVTNAVSTVGAQNIIDACAADGFTLCNLITRNSGGGVTDIDNRNINTGGQSTKGFDGNVVYNLDTEFGTWRFQADFTYVDEFTSTIEDPVTGDDVVFKFAGQAFDRSVLPRVRSNLTANWKYEDITVNYLVRYIHGTTEDCELGTRAIQNEVEQDLCSNPSAEIGGDSTNDLDAMAYHDVSVGYIINDNYRVTAGFNNLWDTDAPVSYSTFANSFDPSMYEIPGRFGYVRFSATF
jgi:iron complex outermembrane receptor protein